jgi:hypothetical protein
MWLGGFGLSVGPIGKLLDRLNSENGKIRGITLIRILK